jgi:hypothetical protein
MQVVLGGTPLAADDATAAVTHALEEAGDALGQAPGGRVSGLRVDLPRPRAGADALAAAMADGIRDGVRRALEGR